MTKVYEFIVVGSGCSGAIAAQTIVEKGGQVLMLDVGYDSSQNKKPKPGENFLSLRKKDKDQYKYLIGENGSGLSWGSVSKGEQITPPRANIMKGVNKFLPMKSDSFEPLVSLAYGGLGAGWGLQCWKFSDYDLSMAGLPKEKMDTAYEIIAKRIGISATKDEARDYTIGGLKEFQRSPSMDRNHTEIYSKYRNKKKSLRRRGFILGRTPLALITRDTNGRKKYAYRDLDFYSDSDRSAWRPWMAVDKLKRNKNFEYLNGLLVTSFKERSNYTEVHCLDVENYTKKIYHCKKLILASGALSTGRIILRSNDDFTTKLPILCNPYRYVPCIQPKFIGKGYEKKKLGFTQLSLFLDETLKNEDVSVSSIYSYQSLMLFRLLRSLPFNFADGRVLTQYLVSGLILIGIHHPDTRSSSKYMKLTKSPKSPTGDVVKASYALSSTDEKEFRRREKR